MTVDTGLRLSGYFGMSEYSWIGLQLDDDAAYARDSLPKVLTDIRP